MRALRFALSVLLVVGVIACTDQAKDPAQVDDAVGQQASGEASVITWPELERRPLNVPLLSAGGDCPVSKLDAQLQDNAVHGAGPIYTPAGGTVVLYPGMPAEDGWLYLKTLWVAAGTYSGPALIRGARIDGAGEMRFSDGYAPQPATALRIPAGQTGTFASGYGPGARYRPSYSQVEGPGCYAWQVDGPDFSYVIVFEVVPTAARGADGSQ